MTETTEALPAWQRGYPLEELRRHAQIFKAHDDGLILGAFGAYKENSVAEALERGRLLAGEGWAMDVEVLKRGRAIRDFSGATRAQAKEGDLYVKRFAYLPEARERFTQALGSLVAGSRCSWALGWIEHPGDQQVMRDLGFDWVCTKIKASSEMTGVYAAGEPVVIQTPEQERVSLAMLRDDLHEPAEELREAVGRLDLGYADHYSGYNVRHSWSALSLRGYGGDPEFIIKPAEMSKKWRRENAEKLDWEIEDTPLRDRLPEAEPLIEAIPGEPHRIRLMRLAPGGGELQRHADITDPDAGTGPGQLLRLHFPIETNEDCLFESWDLLGRKSAARMRFGEAWYLDTRKPHTARNGGESERIHLVVDMAANEATIRWLVPWAWADGDEAPAEPKGEPGSLF
jgi:hypothetical protein